MKENIKKGIFGSVIEISKADYIAEVTNAPKGHFVVLHMY